MSSEDAIETGMIALGPMGSGKTVFLTCLYNYGSALDQKYVVTALRGEEIVIGRYLRALNQRKWPGSTGRKELNEIILRLSEMRQEAGMRKLMWSKGTNVAFQIPDYAGQLLTLPNNPEPGILSKIRDGSTLNEDEQKVMKYISEARGYALIVDPTLPKVAKDNEYDKLLLQMDYNTLVNQFHQSGVLDKPVIVVVTKWDTVRSLQVTPENYVQLELPIFYRHIKSVYKNEKLTFAEVWLENDSKGPTVPLQPNGYEGILNWILNVMS